MVMLDAGYWKLKLSDAMNLVSNTLLAALPLLAQAGKSYSFSWAIVLFFIILGLLVTLASSRRTTEIKRPKDE
jgi:hypothetical protein